MMSSLPIPSGLYLIILFPKPENSASFMSIVQANCTEIVTEEDFEMRPRTEG